MLYVGWNVDDCARENLLRRLSFFLITATSGYTYQHLSAALCGVVRGLAATVVFVLVELMTVGLTSIWFAAGSFVAFIIALLGGNVVVQGIAFILVSVVLLALTKPWAGKYINSRTVKTNVDSLVGERAVLTEDADSMKQTGKAVVNGQEWTVRPQDETQVIRKGELIEVVKISGVKLIVKRVKEA